MDYPTCFLGLFLMPAGGVLVLLLLRKFIYHLAFFSASKTRVRKIRKAWSVLQSLTLLDALGRENRARTAVCLICYHLYCIGGILCVLTGPAKKKIFF